MIRCSFKSAHGCVPAEQSHPSASTIAASWARRSAIRAGTSAKLEHRPIFTSTSDAISSPTRCDSTGCPRCPRLDLLEPVDQVDGDRVEQRELLFHGHGEVLTGLELLACESELLVRAHTLFVAHESGQIRAPACPHPGSRFGPSCLGPPRRAKSPTLDGAFSLVGPRRRAQRSGGLHQERASWLVRVGRPRPPSRAFRLTLLSAQRRCGQTHGADGERTGVRGALRRPGAPAACRASAWVPARGSRLVQAGC